MPLVSVIMSTCSRGHFLKQALESVLNQSFSDFEFIIIDDASSDNTDEILKSCTDKRLRLYKNKKQCGCTFNYHNAQNLAQGEFTAHIDDDDIWHKDKLAKQIEFMNRHPEITLSGTFIETFGENRRPSWVFDTDSTKLDFMINFYNPICHSSVIFRNSFIRKNCINYDMNKLCAQDYDLYKQIILNGGTLANLPEVLVQYRMHKIRLTDVKETQDIQSNNAEKIKKELLKRFLSGDEIVKITEQMTGFPFNEYNTADVLNAIDYAGRRYTEKYSAPYEIIEAAKNDIKNGLYKF